MSLKRSFEDASLKRKVVKMILMEKKKGKEKRKRKNFVEIFALICTLNV